MQQQRSLKINFREIFRIARFSTFATKSAQSERYGRDDECPLPGEQRTSQGSATSSRRSARRSASSRKRSSNGSRCHRLARSCNRAGGLTQNTVPLKEQKTCGSADLGTIAASARQSSRRDDLMDRLYDIEHRVQTTRALATIRSRFRGRYRAPNLQGVRSRLAGWRRFPECAGR
jgi:hypothetical protein